MKSAPVLYSKNKVFLLTLIPILVSCKNNTQEFNKGDYNNTTALYTSSELFCGISTAEREEAEKIEVILQQSIAKNDFAIARLKLNDYKLSKENDLTAISNLLINLEEITRKYTLDNMQNKNKVFEFIENLTNKLYEVSNTSIKINSSPSYLLNYSQEEKLFIQEQLNALKAQLFTKKFRDTINIVKKKNNLNGDYVPLLDSIDKTTQELLFFHITSGVSQSIKIVSTEQFKSLLNFKNYYKENLNSIKPYVKINRITHKQILNLEDPSSLKTGLGIKIIFDYFAHNNNIYDNTSKENTNLIKMLKIDAYINLTQASLDLASNANKISKIIEAISSGSLEKSAEFFQSLEKINSKINIAITGASVILDALEFSNAENATQKIQFGTQLAFDSANLGMFAGSSLLAWSGASTASSFLGALTVPLTGLAIGFTGFAQAAAKAQGESINMASFFYNYEHDHILIGSEPSSRPFVSLAHKNFEYENDTIKNAKYSDIVIKEIDLSSTNKMKITFGSHYVYETLNWDKVDKISRIYIDSFERNPTPIHDKSRAIAIRDDLGIQSIKNVSLLPKTSIILPIMPVTYVSYGFGYTPGILSRHDAELSTVRKMQRNKNFLFEYMTGIFTEESIRSLDFEYVNTDIKVKLGSQNRMLITPTFPNIWKNKISYNIEGTNGEYILKLSKGAHYNILTTGQEKWIINASDLNDEVKIFPNKLKIGEVNIDFTSPPKDLLLVQNSGITTHVSLEKNKQNIILADFKVVHKNSKNIKEILKRTTTQLNQTEGYIELANHSVLNMLRKSWYDIKNNFIIYPRSKNATYINELQLLGRNGNKDYYYNKVSKQIFYQEDSHSEIIILERNIKNAKFVSGQILAESELGYILLIKNPNEIKLFEVKSNSIDINNLKNFSLENEYILNDEILIFKDEEFFGWYISKLNKIISFEEIKEIYDISNANLIQNEDLTN